MTMKERIQNFKNKDAYTVDDVRELVEILRSEDGCAWDREQTHESVRNAIIEETYEFIEGLDSKNTELMKEELGDVAFQVFFHARMAEENGTFNMDDIADGVCKKMVLRHPHVFGDVTVSGSDEVLKNWDAIKKTEKSRDTMKKQLESVSAAVPSLIRAEKLLSRYKREGGEVEKNPEKLIAKIQADAAALTASADSETIGELLFSVANLTYALKLNAEQTLYDYNNRFIEEKTEDKL